jgi:steroid delta-isomerase-like uncharacterized protein
MLVKEAPLNALEVAQRYFGTWNARDLDGIVGALAANGTHQDPVSGGPLQGEALRQHAARLFATFPDVRFDVQNAAAAGERAVAVEWRMCGTNSGSLAGAAASGRTIELPGADFIALDGDRIASVRRYFDRMSFLGQLGLQISAQPPYPMPSVKCGSSAYLSVEKPVRPGAISLTWIAPRSTQEGERLRGQIERIMQQMPGTDGFLSMMLADCAGKMYTSAAWSDVKTAEAMSTRGAHLEAMQDFWKGDLGSASMTSIWVPFRINGPHVRCTHCDQMADYSRDEGRCSCGAALPEPPPYW